ncbi:SWIM zinc finger family protein [Polaromonas sp.]|uniref:SWIM zinc finger family protein n=1 Tax=Polaromonas sp. TaxID=1869339 RepID=UPI00356A00EB
MSYYGWKPYVTVGQRQKLAEKAATKAKKSGKPYTPILAYRGAVAKTVWGKSWCDHLEAYSDYANRLPRGATYVRNGSVIHLQLTAGAVHAQVMGSSLYAVNVTVQPVQQAQWKSICQDSAGSIASLVEILQGKLSTAIMQRICEPGKGLMPTPQEINFDCSCPDWAGMCKHVAAVLYGVGARLDQQPELLFTLRHVDAKDLIQVADGGLVTARKAPKAAKVLDDSLLADVFGLEMAQTTDAPPAKKIAVKVVKTMKAIRDIKAPGIKKPAAKKVAAKKVTAKKATVKAIVKAAPTPKSASKKVATKVAAKVAIKTPAGKKASVKKRSN